MFSSYCFQIIKNTIIIMDRVICDVFSIKVCIPEQLISSVTIELK